MASIINNGATIVIDNYLNTGQPETIIKLNVSKVTIVGGNVIIKSTKATGEPQTAKLIPSQTTVSGTTFANANELQSYISSILNISTTGVLSFSAGVTGLTPNVATQGNVTLGGVLNELHGGTNQSSYAIGDILYATAVNTLGKLPVGVNGEVLTLSGGVPVWIAPAAAGVTNVTATAPITSTGGATPDISTSMNTGRLIGRTNAGVGVFEEISIGAGLTLAAGTLSVSAATVALSAITAATATNSINNVDFEQDWAWNSLAANHGLHIQANTTLASSSTQKLFRLTLSGANANASQTTYASHIENTHTGTTPVNIGQHISVTGAVAGASLYGQTIEMDASALPTNTVGLFVYGTKSNFEAARFRYGTLMAVGAGDCYISIEGRTRTHKLGSGNGLVYLEGNVSAVQLYSSSTGSTTGFYVDTTNNVIAGANASVANTRFTTKGSATTSTTWAFLAQNSTPATLFSITNSASVLIGTTTANATATNTLGILNGTAPSAGLTDAIQIYSSDLSAGNTMLSLYTEGTVVGVGTPAADRTIAIRHNGTVYYLLASTIP